MLKFQHLQRYFLSGAREGTRTPTHGLGNRRHPLSYASKFCDQSGVQGEFLLRYSIITQSPAGTTLKSVKIPIFRCRLREMGRIAFFRREGADVTDVRHPAARLRNFALRKLDTVDDIFSEKQQIADCIKSTTTEDCSVLVRGSNVTQAAVRMSTVINR